ncbi:hypothetical protein EVAR_15695_1 [Eumeta japonica]|uniref:Uncharacterized protein n=1 Tax=Eumeta variegata TaxID=151549 RepID=A0A4C1U9H9_EUMVA|nr:hypothetical protein EVAR_15695_1 [Eumeta japonica]
MWQRSRARDGACGAASQRNIVMTLFMNIADFAFRTTLSGCRPRPLVREPTDWYRKRGSWRGDFRVPAAGRGLVTHHQLAAGGRDTPAYIKK